MVDQALEDDDFGIDLASYEQKEDEDFEDRTIDMESYATQAKKEPSWQETIEDVATQASRGLLKAFTWPADILKLGMIGEGLSDLDQVEEAFQKAGKPFDREKYVRDVFETSRFIPTQELAEKGIENLTGLSLEAKTPAGKRTKQLSEVAAFTPGGVAKKITAGALAAGTTEALKTAGLSEGKAELAGDVASLSPELLKKTPQALSKAAQQTEKTARKYALPFLEFMTKEKAPILQGKLFKSTEERIKKEFNLSSQQALEKIVKDQLPLARLRDKGVNLDALGEHAYAETLRLAQKNPQPIKTDAMVKNIDAEISRLQKLAPSPSDAQKAAINLLEQERDVLRVSNPTSEQLINQHMNYNADMKQIYKKPEFSGKENEVRKTYEFLKNQLVDSMEKQGAKSTANAFKAANKIYHEKSKLFQTEKILGKAFDGKSYSPKKLKKILNSKDGEFLRRNMSESAVKDIEEIADYGIKANEKMEKFINIDNSAVTKEVKTWGQLAPLIFLPHNIKGALLTFAPILGKYVQGKLLIRPATREVYKLTLKHASEGAFELLKKDFAKLEEKISEEWGSVDDFIDNAMSELEIYNDEEE